MVQPFSTSNMAADEYTHVIILVENWRSKVQALQVRWSAKDGDYKIRENPSITARKSHRHLVLTIPCNIHTLDRFSGMFDHLRVGSSGGRRAVYISHQGCFEGTAEFGSKVVKAL
jgi:hypothetical protein